MFFFVVLKSSKKGFYKNTFTYNEAIWNIVDF